MFYFIFLNYFILLEGQSHRDRLGVGGVCTFICWFTPNWPQWPKLGWSTRIHELLSSRPHGCSVPGFENFFCFLLFSQTMNS